MPVLRVRFSIRRLMIVATAMGLNFGVLPWPACAVMGAALTLPLFLSSVRWVEWVVIYGYAGVLAALSMPPVITTCRMGIIEAPPERAPSISVPVSAPTCEDPPVPLAPER
jgi:hypothetical protein